MVNKIILGTVQFGLDYGINNLAGKPPREQVFSMLEYAAKHNVELLDTADAYGNAIDVLGDFNSVHSGFFSINTKFKGNQEPLAKQLSHSLNLLNLKAINTYFFHNYNDLIVYPELLRELVILKQKNKIKKIGISVYDNNEFSIAINTPEIDVIQFPFNLLDNLFQRGLLMKLAKEKGKELQVRSVFLQGLFFMPLDKLPAKLTPLKPYLNEIYNLSVKYKLAIEEIALLYALSQNEIDHVIIGVDNMEQLKNNLKIGLQKTTPDLIEIINQIEVKETELLYPKNWN